LFKLQVGILLQEISANFLRSIDPSRWDH